jgi:hypothetical protein
VVQTLGKTVWQLFKSEHILTLNTDISLLSVYSETWEHMSMQRLAHEYLSLFVIHQIESNSISQQQGNYVIFFIMEC